MIGSSCSTCHDVAELNPDEYLNNDLKGSIGAAGLPETRDQLRSRIERFMSRLCNIPEHVCSYF